MFNKYILCELVYNKDVSHNTEGQIYFLYIRSFYNIEKALEYATILKRNQKDKEFNVFSAV